MIIDDLTNISTCISTWSEPDWPQPLLAARKAACAALSKRQGVLNELARRAHLKVLDAFQRARVSTYDLHGSTGYGLDDRGREALDEIVAALMGAEAALVRHQFVSGTHAISAALFGVLRPGDTLLSVTGEPYDTLQTVIGTRGSEVGTLAEWGVHFDAVPLTAAGDIDCEAVKAKVTSQTRLFALQRSKGYAWQGSISIEKIAAFIRFARQHFPQVLIFVDNCYGELVEAWEPGDVGADLLAGSLIKNLGGTIAPTGGYVAGKAKWVKQAAARFAAPGIGTKLGATGDTLRLLLQGLYLSPLTVTEALKSAIFAAAFWQELGFEVSPGPYADRTDIIQAVRLGDPERMVAFCQGLQLGSPVDAYVQPAPSHMPGYTDEVIMAGGTFIQGATSEFSADGPLREPYIVYLQGGVSLLYNEAVHLRAARRLWENGLLTGIPS